MMNGQNNQINHVQSSNHSMTSANSAAMSGIPLHTKKNRNKIGKCNSNESIAKNIIQINTSIHNYVPTKLTHHSPQSSILMR
mmetsp:Transcript_1945/g.1855  ORF Transcript_1945/g.1855 Transcript_1945/m.1855 type:complete len:82 (-) Transcript_1945:1308-1553(-)